MTSIPRNRNRLEEFIENLSGMGPAIPIVRNLGTVSATVIPTPNTLAQQSLAGAQKRAQDALLQQAQAAEMNALQQPGLLGQLQSGGLANMASQPPRNFGYDEIAPFAVSTTYDEGQMMWETRITGPGLASGQWVKRCVRPGRAEAMHAAAVEDAKLMAREFAYQRYARATVSPEERDALRTVLTNAQREVADAMYGDMDAMDRYSLYASQLLKMRDRQAGQPTTLARQRQDNVEAAPSGPPEPRLEVMPDDDGTEAKPARSGWLSEIEARTREIDL